MKRSFIFFTVFLLSTLVHAEIQYAELTLKTYSNASDSKPSGKILPTTGFEVLKVQGDKAQVKLLGWNKGDMARIVYYSKGERIISGAFSKKAQYDLKVLKTEKIGKDEWNNISLITWIENKNLTNDLEALYGKASDLLQTNCGLCHAYHPTHEFSANQWPAVIKGMRPRTPLSKEEGWLITQFAQKHAKK